ncbi:hypothetical protein L3Q82_016098, partial [Scortum barcoo]
MDSRILCSFYRCTIERILTGCITTWYSSCTTLNRKALQRVVKAAQHITRRRRRPPKSLRTPVTPAINCSACCRLAWPTVPAAFEPEPPGSGKLHTAGHKTFKLCSQAPPLLNNPPLLLCDLLKLHKNLEHALAIRPVPSGGMWLEMRGDAGWNDWENGGVPEQSLSGKTESGCSTEPNMSNR